ncbi:MAG: flagellar motor switch protein FliM [Pseudohongiellaceae bacterium]
MTEDQPLKQEEIDALLQRADGEEEPGTTESGRHIRPFDPSSQHRVIRERLHSLDIINERFARFFRINLFNLMRRNADISVSSVDYQSYSLFSRNVPAPANLNLIAMEPLRGTALIMFPPSMVFIVVDNLFGGDGRFLSKSELREFTKTEQRIISRMLNLAIEAYEESWQSIYSLDISYLRSETQAKFANITNSPNEIVITTTFHVEVGTTNSEFQICIPYSMVEPLKELLANPMTDREGKRKKNWSERMANELRHSDVELVADFANIDCCIGDILSLEKGDVLPVELPETVTGSVDGVPVLKCRYGSHNAHRALRVNQVFDHTMNYFTGTTPVKSQRSATEESKNDES